MKEKINIKQMFLSYGTKYGDFEDGVCIVDLRHIDEVILGAMLEQYYQEGFVKGMRKYKELEDKRREQEEFDKHQGKLFDD